MKGEIWRQAKLAFRSVLIFFNTGIYVIPADVGDPVSHVETLKAKLAPLPLLQKELMTPLKDASIPKHYVLLFDTSSSSENGTRKK